MQEGGTIDVTGAHFVSNSARVVGGAIFDNSGGVIYGSEAEFVANAAGVVRFVFVLCLICQLV